MGKSKMGRAERVNAAQKKLAEKKGSAVVETQAEQAESTGQTPNAEVPSPETAAPKQNAVSIRKFITTQILAGTPTKEIAAGLQERFPSSQAAAKSAKHISYYRSLMKKEAKAAAQAVAK